MNIKRQLLLGFSLIILLVSLAAYTTFEMTKESSETFNSALSQQYKKQNSILKMQLSGRSYTLHVQQAILTEDVFDRDEIIMLSYLYARTYNQNRAEFETIMNETDFTWLEGLNAITRKVSAGTEEALTLLVDGQNDVAIELMQKVVFPLSGAFQKQVTWYADAQEAIFKHKLNQEDKLLSDLVFNVATISVVVILVSIGVAVFVGRRIQILANELESSNQDLEGRVNVRTAALKLTQEKLLEKNKYLKQVSREDGLTGVFNRLGISEVLTSQLLRLQHTQEVFSVVFIDIDFFKIINDEHGHAVGDSVLKSVATKINEVVPEGCAVGRWGGEEFLVICPDGLESVLQVAENIRQAIASMEYEGQNKVTVSLGLTQAHEKDLMDGLLKRADDALYQAKREGRNRVIVA